MLFCEPLNLTMQRYGIDNPRRQSAFLAQICHESGSLKYVKEIGDATYFAKYDGRADLGNTEAGDGARYCGRGFAQVTGRLNYKVCGQALGLDLVGKPELLEQPLNASLSAGWFWQRSGFSAFADVNRFGTITKLWNGGYNGLDDRISHYLRIRSALGLRGE